MSGYQSQIDGHLDERCPRYFDGLEIVQLIRPNNDANNKGDSQ